MKEIRQIIKLYDRLKPMGLKMALASIINIEASSYRRVGARMLLCENGEWTGGISGGCLEGDALEKSKIAIFKNKPSHVIYDTMDDTEKSIGVGLGCNGVIEVLFKPINATDPKNEIELLKLIVSNNKPSILLKTIKDPVTDNVGVSKIYDPQNDLFDSNDRLKNKIEEVRIKRRPQIVSTISKENHEVSILVEYIKPETKLVLIGDNYDAIAMTSLVKEMGWEIHLVGRKRKISKVLFDRAKAIYEYEEIDLVPIDEYTAIVLMSHDFEWDKKLLPKIIIKNHSYLGMLGPKKRKEKMFAQLTAISDISKNTIFSPVGLDIGAETPEEIAISIIAEILAVFRKRDGRFLKERRETIHERHL